MANFDELIPRLHADYPDEQARGKAFELVCKWFLTQDPYYGQEFCTGKMESNFKTVIDGERLRSHKRLFMTATPRIVTKRIKDRAGVLDLDVASMDRSKSPACYDPSRDMMGNSVIPEAMFRIALKKKEFDGV